MADFNHFSNFSSPPSWWQLFKADFLLQIAVPLSIGGVLPALAISVFIWTDPSISPEQEIFFLIPVLMALFTTTIPGFWLLNRRLRWIRRLYCEGSRLQAHLEKIEMQRGFRSGLTPTLYLRYRWEGEELHYLALFPALSKVEQKFQAGQIIEVLIDPQNPPSPTQPEIMQSGRAPLLLLTPRSGLIIPAVYE